MNFFGIGTLELLVILLVALVALGPGKTVEVARTIGRMAREARRTFTDIMEAASPDDRPTGNRGNASTPPPASPPVDPLPAPPHLAEQTPATDSPEPAAPVPDNPPETR